MSLFRNLVPINGKFHQTGEVHEVDTLYCRGARVEIKYAKYVLLFPGRLVKISLDSLVSGGYTYIMICPQCTKQNGRIGFVNFISIELLVQGNNTIFGG